MDRVSMTLEYVEDKIFEGLTEQSKKSSQGFTEEENSVYESLRNESSIWKSSRKVEEVEVSNEEIDELDLSQFNKK